MKPILQIVFFLMTPGILFAQHSITGKIIDEQEIGVPFATVLLLNAADSGLVKGSITDAEGKYLIANVDPGNFIIQSSMVGYEKSFSKVLLPNSSVMINDLVLRESSTELEAVVVEAEKPLYEQTIDKMVVNVSSSPVMAGNTVLEILEKSPGVMVDRMNSAVNMNGKNGVNVMINGKLTRIEMSALFNMLDGMPSTNIEQIELITTPPANFDAEGNAGFINLVLKSNDLNGLNGSVTAFAAQRRRSAFGGGGTINYRKNDFNVFADLSLSDIRQNRLADFTSIIDNDEYVFTLTSHADREIQERLGSARFGIDYYVSPRTVIGLLGTAFWREWRNSVLTETYYDINPGIDTLVIGKTDEDNDISQYMFNVNFQHDFSERQRLIIDLDYFMFDQEQPLNYLNEFIPENNQPIDPQVIRMGKTTPLDILVGKLDYRIDLSDQISMEVGAKTTMNEIENEVITEWLIDDTWQVDDYFSDYTYMEEDINAGYISFNMKFDDRLSAKAGLRYEHTVTDLRDSFGQQLVYRNYDNFFPTAFVQRKLSENGSLNLAYSYRINRPTFSDLAPFVLLADPRTFFTGNTQLLPSLTHSLKTFYSFKGLSASFEYNQIKNSIARFQASRIADSDVTLYASLNLDRTTMYSLNLSLPITVTQWWEMNYNLSGIMSHVTSKYYDDYMEVSASWATINATQDFTLPRKFSVQVSAIYFSESLIGAAVRQPYGMVSFGIRKELEKSLGNLNLSITDIFRTNILHWTIDAPQLNFYNDVRLDSDVTSIQLTYTNSFGGNNFKSRSKRETGAAEDLKRL